METMERNSYEKALGVRLKETGLVMEVFFAFGYSWSLEHQIGLKEMLL